MGWTSVKDITIDNTGLQGSIPASWGAIEAFPALTSLELTGNQFSGGLDVLGFASSLPALAGLLLNNNHISGGQILVQSLTTICEYQVASCCVRSSP